MKISFPFLPAVVPALLILTAAAPAAPRPNIVLCMTDDMGWGDPKYNSITVTAPDGTFEATLDGLPDPHPDQGWISTPTLDTMVAKGLRFGRFYAASAVCSPTRASCLTGRNPFRVGVPKANSGRLGFDETPLSEVLSEAGYRCAHIGKWHLGSLTTLRPDSRRGGDASVYSAPWHHGFDFCFSTESAVPTYHPYRQPANGTALPTSFDKTNDTWFGTYYWRMPATWNESSGEGEIVPINEVNDPENGDASKLLVDQAIPFMQGAVADSEPFFLVLWLHAPHFQTVDPQQEEPHNTTIPVERSIEDVDTALGRLRTELDKLKVRGNTMLWFCSDNGPHQVDSPADTGGSLADRSVRSGRFYKRKTSLFEGGVRVPGILEWPDVIGEDGGVTEFPAVTSDYYPTILDYLELSVPGQKPLDGISLRPVIENPVAVTTRAKPIGFRYGSQDSWVNQQYKLIKSGGTWYLYDLVNIAPGEEVEQTALATSANVGSQPQAVQDIYNTMKAEYDAWAFTVRLDTPYVHVSQPTVTLSTPSATVSAPFTVTATFSEPVTELHANEFAVTNGAASGLAGGGTTWTVTVTPALGGAVTVDLPEGSVIDADGTLNAPSNTLVTTFSVPSGVGEVGSVDQGLFAGSTGGVTQRMVFGDDLGNIATVDITLSSSVSGTITNNGTGIDLDAAGSTDRADWFDNNDSSNPEDAIITATLVDTTGFIDPSAIEFQWTSAWVKYDLLANSPTNAGELVFNSNAGASGVNLIGGDNDTKLETLDTAFMDLDAGDYTGTLSFGASARTDRRYQFHDDNAGGGGGMTFTLHYSLVSLPAGGLVVSDFHEGPNPEDVTIEWDSLEGGHYRIEADDDLQAPWTNVAVVTGDPGSSTTYIHSGGLTGFTERFYRVAFLGF